MWAKAMHAFASGYDILFIKIREAIDGIKYGESGSFSSLSIGFGAGVWCIATLILPGLAAWILRPREVNPALAKDHAVA
jgi:hypothetical protein